MSIRDDLASFPSILRAWDHSKADEPQASYLRVLLDAHADGIDFGLTGLEATLGLLLRSRTADQLQEQLRALFADEDEWNKATSELLGLAFFEERGELESTGWPQAGGTDTPPFDGRASLRGSPLPFDIKPAIGGTFGWLKDVLEPELSRWQPGAELDLTFASHGVYARQAIAPHVKALTGGLRTFLAGKTLQELPLETTLVAGGQSIDITVRRKDGDVTVNTHVGSPAERGKRIATTMLSHIKSKAAQAEKNAVPFFLLYVRPPDSGAADFAGHVFPEVRGPVLDGISGVVQGRRWLGTIYVDYTPSPTQIYVLTNPAADWPPGLIDKDFEEWALGA